MMLTWHHIFNLRGFGLFSTMFLRNVEHEINFPPVNLMHIENAFYHPSKLRKYRSCAWPCFITIQVVKTKNINFPANLQFVGIFLPYLVVYKDNLTYTRPKAWKKIGVVLSPDHSDPFRPVSFGQEIEKDATKGTSMRICLFLCLPLSLEHRVISPNRWAKSSEDGTFLVKMRGERGENKRRNCRDILPVVYTHKELRRSTFRTASIEKTTEGEREKAASALVWNGVDDKRIGCEK